MSSERIREEWDAVGFDYRVNIDAGNSSSAWLRDLLLKPTVKRLLGDRLDDRVLDVGTGGGWLFEQAQVAEAHACDLVRPEYIPGHVQFEIADVARLPYPDQKFHAVVASVVLCYCEDLAAAAGELARVSADGGTAVIALVHPYFYRTGQAFRDGSFRVTADLSQSASFPIHIGGRVGPLTYYLHRPDAYVNAFIQAGWRLSHMEDAFIPRGRYLERFGSTDEVERATKVPLFTFFRFDR